MTTYETIARLGRGGMGVVDLARDPEGNRVALKRITLTGSAGDIIRARQRLLREAEVLRRLHHPNVMRLVDVLDEGDEIVLVMPYLNGGSLAERVTQHGPAPADEVERQARRLFGALAQAHAAGVVHRDIKPANILFDERGEPLLADFGVAHTPDQTQGLTVTGMVVGTPGFMAPEQARGETVTPASDVFSLGATLLYAATGEGPFGTGDPGLLMVRAASNKVEKVPKSLPSSLRRLLKETLHTKPERRPTAAALVSPQGFLSSLPTVGRPRTPASWAVAGGALAGVVIVAGAFVVIDRDDDSGGDAGLVPTSGCLAGSYQPCDGPPADNTDGERCLDGFVDADGEPANGCEADDGTATSEEPSPTDTLGVSEGEVQGRISPGETADVWTVAPPGVSDPSICERPVVVTLTAPQGMDLMLQVQQVDTTTIGEAPSPAGQSGSVSIGDPCGLISGQVNVYELGFRAVVQPMGQGRVDAPYSLRVEPG